MAQKASAVMRSQRSEVSPHQLGQKGFKTIFSEDIDWEPFRRSSSIVVGVAFGRRERRGRCCQTLSITALASGVLSEQRPETY
jgi:hypothetical protein